MEKCQEYIRDIAENIVPNALPEISLRSVSLVEASAKERVPVLTGALRDSIITEVTESSRSSVTLEVGPTVDYADDVEFGGIRRAAQPYLRPAADENEEAVVEALAQELNQLLEDL